MNSDNEYNLYTIQKDYIDRILDEVNGKKMLILDDMTLPYISSILTHTDMLKKQVYMITTVDKMKLDNNKIDIDDVSIVYIVHPVLSNIDHLIHMIDCPFIPHIYLYTTYSFPYIYVYYIHTQLMIASLNRSQREMHTTIRSDASKRYSRPTTS